MKKLKFWTLLSSLVFLVGFLTIQPTCTPIKEIVEDNPVLRLVDTDIEVGSTEYPNKILSHTSGQHNIAVGYSSMQTTTTGTYSGPFGDTIYLTMLGFANYCLELDVLEPTRAHIEKYYKQGVWEYYRKHIIK